MLLWALGLELPTIYYVIAKRKCCLGLSDLNWLHFLMRREKKMMLWALRLELPKFSTLLQKENVALGFGT